MRISFLQLWRESMSDWNFYVTGWWIGAPLICIIVCIIFLSSLIQIIIMSLFLLSIIIFIPIVFTFIDALDNYRWCKMEESF
ncbi:hypothetical protein KAI04_04095 [Candidatus Pacearchaeota archaeon]|nr:hypothetical protein [Candidatus Pacearchaeota archaeon]